MSIARAGRDFDEGEHDLFAYLAGQAAVSIENVDLHEMVRIQAVTDELTGLYNLRHFHETLDSEIERSRRFGTDVGLVMLDIDDFKRVNDTYGHQQGDLVLIEVGRVLRKLSRDIDEPARYGGEEMAVILPQTDVAGAELLAERMRAAMAGSRSSAWTARASLRSPPASASRRSRQRARQGRADRRGRRRPLPSQALRQEQGGPRGACDRGELTYARRMGALDDAIREHLELKRRHGASRRRDPPGRGGGARARPPGAPLAPAGSRSTGGRVEPARAGIAAPPRPSRAVHDAPPPPPGLGQDAVAEIAPTSRRAGGRAGAVRAGAGRR